ncbi:hypothetical protein ACQP3L_31265, partial [Escherichia coli]
MGLKLKIRKAKQLLPIPQMEMGDPVSMNPQTALLSTKPQTANELLSPPTTYSSLVLGQGMGSQVLRSPLCEFYSSFRLG